MSIFSEFLNKRRERKVSVEEKKFNQLDATSKKKVCEKLLALKQNAFAKEIEKRPFLLPFVIADLNKYDFDVLNAIDIATKKGVSVYDLVDKNQLISNQSIVNIVAKNQPDLILELDDMPALQDLITPETVIAAFTKNPEIIFSNCKALDTKIKVSGTNRDGTEGSRTTSLKTQLQRAMNIYFRPESYTGNKYDSFAKAIADKINSAEFTQKVQSNKMTTRSTTAANETLKRNPKKGQVMPAKTLKNWNNRVLYTIPNQVKKQIKLSKQNKKYNEYMDYLKGLLINPSLNAFNEQEKTKLAKRCVSLCPELVFELQNINGFENISEKLTVQLSAYEAFKTRNQTEMIEALFEMIGQQNTKKVIARHKANVTRKSNHSHKIDQNFIKCEYEVQKIF